MLFIKYKKWLMIILSVLCFNEHFMGWIIILLAAGAWRSMGLGHARYPEGYLMPPLWTSFRFPLGFRTTLRQC